MVETRILETKVDNIFGFDKRIRFVALLTNDGEVIAEFLRPGVVSLEPPSETKIVYTRASIAIGMSSPMDRYHGRIKTAVIIREKVIMLYFNLNSRMILISVEPSFPLDKVEEMRRLVETLGIS